MNTDYSRGFVGELIGTFLLVFLGCGTVAVSVLFSAHVGLYQVAAVWGGGVTLAIYITRYLSCAHLNPAVSLAMVIAGRMHPKKLPVYWLAQVAGGFIAGMVLYGIFSHSILAYESANRITRGAPDSIKTAMIFGEYFPNPSFALNADTVTMTEAFFIEAMGTFLLVIIIFALTEGCNVGRPSSDIAPILIGLTVTIIISIFAPLTQAGINPARDFGPRLFAYLAGWDQIAIPGPRGGFFMVYVLGPIIGGTAAAVFFNRVMEPLMKNKVPDCGCHGAQPEERRPGKCEC